LFSFLIIICISFQMYIILHIPFLYFIASTTFVVTTFISIYFSCFLPGFIYRILFLMYTPSPTTLSLRIILPYIMNFTHLEFRLYEAVVPHVHKRFLTYYGHTIPLINNI
jgi:hypothetical protein